jgi:hypothetical protein
MKKYPILIYCVYMGIFFNFMIVEAREVAPCTCFPCFTVHGCHFSELQEHPLFFLTLCLELIPLAAIISTDYPSLYTLNQITA